MDNVLWRRLRRRSCDRRSGSWLGFNLRGVVSMSAKAGTTLDAFGEGGGHVKRCVSSRHRRRGRDRWRSSCVVASEAGTTGNPWRGWRTSAPSSPTPTMTLTSSSQGQASDAIQTTYRLSSSTGEESVVSTIRRVFNGQTYCAVWMEYCAVWMEGRENLGGPGEVSVDVR